MLLLKRDDGQQLMDFLFDRLGQADQFLMELPQLQRLPLDQQDLLQAKLFPLFFLLLWDRFFMRRDTLHKHYLRKP